MLRLVGARELRARPGFEIDSGGWSVLVQGETTAVLDERYNSRGNRKTRFPLIADPGNVEPDRTRYAIRAAMAWLSHWADRRSNCSTSAS